MPIASALDYEAAFSQQEVAQLCGADSTRLAQALESAQAECISYIAQRYAIPANGAQAGHALKQAVLNVARYRLFDKRASDEVRTRYEDTISWLRDVSKGMCALISADGQILAAAPTPERAIGLSNQASGNSGLSAFGSAFEAAHSPRLLG